LKLLARRELHEFATAPTPPKEVRPLVTLVERRAAVAELEHERVTFAESAMTMAAELATARSMATSLPGINGEVVMPAPGVRREKAALFQWVQGPPGNRSNRKQSEQSWR
jgi:hypothetical protein